MTSRENLIHRGSPKRSFRRLAAKLAVAACAALAATAATGTSPARASTVPYHRYTVSCSPGVIYLPGDAHPYYLIKIMPDRIDAMPGVGVSLVDGTGTFYGSSHQYIYFWLWIWNKTANGSQWQHTAAKRVLDGWPVMWDMEAWDRQYGAWMNSSLGDFFNPTIYDPNNPSNSSEMLVFGYELGMYVRADVGRTWTFTVETEWAPPFAESSWPSAFDPRIPSGGLDGYDRTSNGAWPTVTCPS